MAYLRPARRWLSVGVFSCEMRPFVYVLPILSVLVLTGARLRELGRKRDTIHGPIRETLTLRLFLLTGLVASFGSIVEYCLRGGGVHWPTFAAGWVFGICSFILRRQAIAALGRFWSLHVEIRANHEFVRSGPFHFMRHPVYCSMVLELLAFATICHAWITALLTPLLFAPVLRMRVRLEEAALTEKFGASYQEYRRSTPAIFPRLW